MSAPAPSPRVETAWFDDHTGVSAVVYDESRSMVHRFNDTAAVVWSMVDGESTIEQISTELAHAFGAPIAVVQSDVDALIAQFREKGLLAGSEDDLITVTVGHSEPREVLGRWVLPSAVDT